MPQKYSKKLKDIIIFLLNRVMYINPLYKIVKPYIPIIEKETSWLPKKTSLNERIFCIQNDIFKNPKCNFCRKNNVEFIDTISGYKKCCSKPCIKLNLSKYLSENMTQEKRDQKSETQKEIWDKRTSNERHIIGNKIYTTKLKTGTFNMGYSKSSQKLFEEIYKKLPQELKNETYFAKLNKEFGKNKKYCYDFVISSIKVCIEFNGEHVHPNPKMTRDNWKGWKQAWSGKTANEVYFQDQIKLDVLRDQNFIVLEIWEKDYYKNPDKELNQCLNFIFKKLSELFPHFI